MNADLLSEPLLRTVLALAAIFLGLAAAVEILQEFYKYLTSSKARTYEKALADFTGPWVQQILRPGALTDLKVRGPLQMFKVRPAGKLLPMTKEELVKAAERTAPIWVRRTLEQLDLERKLQQAAGAIPWSPAWRELLQQLEQCDPEAPTAWDAEQVREFLGGWNAATPRPEVSPESLYLAFRSRFLPEAVRIEEFHPQLERNLEYAYERRNLRQTFLFALLLAVMFNLPFRDLLRDAQQTSLEDAISLASSRVELYERSLVEARSSTADEAAASETEAPAGNRSSANVDTPGEATRAITAGAEGLEQHLERLESDLKELIHRSEGDARVSQPLFSRGWNEVARLWREDKSVLPFYFLNCLITAVLISFGAPLWHNLSSTLLRVARDRKSDRREAS